MTTSVKAVSAPLSKAWMIAMCGGLFYCYQFILRVSPNMMTAELMQAFSVDATQLGVIIAFYYYAYAGAQVPLGVSMDKYGPKKLLVLAALTCGLSCYAFSLATNVYVASATRFLMGLGSACGFLGTLKLGTLWFPPIYLSRVIALAMIMGTLGAALGGSPLEFLLDTLGWRLTLQMLAGIGLVITAILHFVIDDVPFVEESTESMGSWQKLKTIMSNPQSWIIGIFGMLMYIPIAIIGDLWGVSFISVKYNVSEAVAATVVTAMFIGVGVGSPFMTYLSDYTRRRRTPMLIGAVCTALLYFIIVNFSCLPFEFLYIAFFAAGFLFNGQCLCFAAASESNPREASGTAIGFTNMVVMGSGILGHPIVGKLMDSRWDGRIVDGTPVYSATHYEFALLFIPIALALAVLAVTLMRETYPRS